MAQMAMGMPAFRVPDSLPSDSEESVVGTEWHQEAIGTAADRLREAARRYGTTWGVCEQVALVGLRHEDGSPYDPRPDVMVLARQLPSGSVSSIHVDQAGVPLFIMEVASNSTVGNDVGDKRHAYAAIGVAEYLVFDPDGDILSTPLLAWRLVAGVYVPWRPEPDGWWKSGALDVAFQATQPYLSIRDRNSQQIELAHEVRQRAERLQLRVAELEEELRQLRGQRAEDALWDATVGDGLDAD
jgi:Uma2 family endonuclease